MAKFLSQYSDTNGQLVEYASNTEYVDQLERNSVTQRGDDYNTPFTYKQWRNRMHRYISEDNYRQYNVYLRGWYSNRYKKTDYTKTLNDDYMQLVQKLQLLFEDDEDFRLFSNVDFDDQLEIENAIPFYARKLKEIALYMVSKRDAIKRAKLKYNMSGSSAAVERLFYDYILKAFTKRDYVCNVPDRAVLDEFPALSSVKDGFSIKIEELYDDTQYLDKDPTMPTSGYFDDYDLGWLFSSGMQPVCADNPFVWVLNDMVSSMPISSFETYDVTSALNDYNRIELSKKYLGSTINYVSGGYYIFDTTDIEIPLKEGNNWFYWPSGEHINDTQNTQIFDPIYLSDTVGLSAATAAEEYQSADKIFVRACDSDNVSGAWRRKIITTPEIETMSARIVPDVCNGIEFIYPFPGYGVAADGVEWSGPELNNLSLDYYYLDDDQKRSVRTLYWANTSERTFDDLNIHDTTLIDSGAFASTQYKTADKLQTRNVDDKGVVYDPDKDAVYNGDINHAWLYKMLNTDIPVSVGKTNIFWPLQKYDNQGEVLVNSSSGICNPIQLSSVNASDYMIGSRAGHSLFDSDIIYKLDSPDGYPVEAAFLSGVEITEMASSQATLMYGATGVIQPSLTLKFRPNRTERFLWYDDNTYIDETTINHHEHQNDCPYKNQVHTSIHSTRGNTLESLGQLSYGIGNWNKCTCRAILYNPFGHPGSSYTDYSSMTDVIVVDSTLKEDISRDKTDNDLDLTKWVDSEGRSPTNSPDFAYYCLTGENIEEDAGWGKGYWKTGDGSRFELKKGVIYKYVRSNIQRNSGDLVINAVPSLIIKQKHQNTPECVWMKAVLSEDGDWGSANTPSDMILGPSDNIAYDHVDSNWFCLSTQGNLQSLSSYPDILDNRDSSKWTNYTYMTSGYDLELEWPQSSYIGGPTNLYDSMKEVKWAITDPDDNTRYISKINLQTKTKYFIEKHGTYTIEATGYMLQGGYEIFSDIPPVISEEPQIDINTIGEYGSHTVYIDSINFTINVPLNGWNYAAHFYDGESEGARPFWAKAYNDDRDQTKRKGVDVWGGGIRVNVIDDYTFVTQPDFSDVVLRPNTYIKYNRLGTSNLTWVEDIDFDEINEYNIWSMLVMNSPVSSPINDYLYNITEEMILSASDEESDILLAQDKPLFVNYWANSAFTWTETLSDTSMGIPPTGGLFIEQVTGVLVEPTIPYANLKNAHYPTIAIVADKTNLYSEADVGGYFTPNYIGTSIAQSRGLEHNLSVIDNMPVGSRFGIYRDLSLYGKDSGFTGILQETPASLTGSDVQWMKAGVTTGERRGIVENAISYQEFSSYQTKYETTKSGSVGIRRSDDEYDPWIGPNEDLWINEKEWPSDFRGQLNISGWYNAFVDTSNTRVYQWKTDIYGNEYYLLKDNTINGIYDQSVSEGFIYFRNRKGLIAKLFDVLENLESTIVAKIGEDISQNILDIDLWFDTLMIRTHEYLVFSKIKFEYATEESETDRVYTLPDTTTIIETGYVSGGKFGGLWFEPKDNNLTFSIMNSGTFLYPEIYKFDLGEFIYKKILKNPNTDSMILDTSAISLGTYEYPVLSYDSESSVYNISFIGYGKLYNGMVVESINIDYIGNDCFYKDILVVLPSTPLPPCCTTRVLDGYSNWGVFEINGIDGLEAGCTLYVNTVMYTVNQPNLGVTIFDADMNTVATGSRSGSYGIITLEEVNNSGVTGTFDWQEGQAYLNEVELICVVTNDA